MSIESSQLQELVLHTLDREGKIPDTSILNVNGHSIDPQLLLGVLKRLETHEV